MSESAGTEHSGTDRSMLGLIRPEVVTLSDISVSMGVHEVEATTGPSMSSVVFVHGLAQDRSAWELHQEQLARFHSVSYDLRGHGSTTLGTPRGSLVQLAEDLCEVLERVTGPAYCVGHSLGGTIALWAAATRPDLVRGVVASATSSVLSTAGLEFYLERIKRVESGTVDELAEILAQDTQAMIWDRADVDVQALIERRVRAVGDGRGYLNALHALAGLKSEPLQRLLPRIECRVLSISGQYDELCPRRAAEILLEGVRFGQDITISDAGHMVPLERRFEYCAAIEGFVTSEEQRQ